MTNLEVAAPVAAKRLKILVVTSSLIPVPPPRYGGIEREVAQLVSGLHARGHDVTLMAGTGSKVPCRLVTYSEQQKGSKAQRAWAKAAFWARLAGMLPHYDVLHWHGRADYFEPAALRPRMAKVVTFHNPIIGKDVEHFRRLGGRNLAFVSISDAQSRHVRNVGRWITIHNGIETNGGSATKDQGGAQYLLFLGRLSRDKGAHTAIKLAKATGERLLIVGKANPDPQSAGYFESEIAPHLKDGQIEYLGEVDNDRKETLLAKAKALLFPIEWDEPFGRVVVEALAHGTPVIASKRGAVPEIITHGVEGFICESEREMVQAVGMIDKIDRSACRHRAETAFSVDALVTNYERLYASMMENGGT
ncbi:MAG: glycosyltransferase family 4 protein [Euryarchaeota archaeon]|nr:glycosyltransferase family 4 protein [Euryarchaeota archaeon]